MKHLVFFQITLLLSLVIILFSCGTSEPTEAEKAQAVADADSLLAGIMADLAAIEAEVPVNPMGIWRLDNFVDDFGDETGAWFVRNKRTISGSFSNSATNNSKLEISFMVTNDLKVCIMLYEYAGNNPVKHSSSTSYKVRIKPSSGDPVELTGSNHSDRLCFKEKASKQLCELLSAGGELIFFLVEQGTYSSSSYKFTIANADGFALALKKLGK